MEVQQTTRKPGKMARLRNRFRNWFRKRSIVTQGTLVLIMIWLVLLIFAERSAYGVLLLKLRIYTLAWIIFGGLIWVAYKYFWKRLTPKKKVRWGIGLGIFLLLDIFVFKLTPWGMYDYASSYYRYQTIQKVYLDELPETDHEAIQPRIIVYTAANQQLQGTNTVSKPFLVRDDSTYQWTLVVEPNTFKGRFSRNVSTVYSVPAENQTISFSGRNQSEVSFNVAERLYLGRQAHTATMRKLSFFQLFSYEVGIPRFMKDDDGEWVEVVPLIKWKGILFPQPVFGGVNVIRQNHRHDIGNTFRRFLLGEGTIYTPKQMKKFRYLQNQNLMPEEVTLSIARSFRFQKGFWAPMPWNHNNDTRIPKVEEDGMDEQPMTVFFKMSHVAEAKDMLYEYVGLETYDESKNGLLTSIFIPSDGEMVVYTYHYDSRKDEVVGATAIPSRVKSKFPTIDWDHSKVSAIRPYIKLINDTIRSCWRATVVTRDKDGGGWYSPANSNIALVDPIADRIVMVEAAKPQTWLAAITADTSTVSKVP